MIVNLMPLGMELHEIVCGCAPIVECTTWDILTETYPAGPFTRIEIED